MAAKKTKIYPSLQVRQKTARRLHRRVGYTISIFLILLLVSGVMMHRSVQWGLEDVQVRGNWLTSWYQPAPRGALESYPVGAHWISGLEGRLYLDGAPLDNGVDVKGAVFTQMMGQDILVVAEAEALLLLTPKGQLVEKMSLAFLPGEIFAIGVDAQYAVVISTPYGPYRATDETLMTWVPTPAEGIFWSKREVLPAILHEDVMAAYYDAGVSLMQFINDLHTGRIMGPVGVWVMDLTALGLLFLLISGLFRMRPKR